MSKDSKKLQQNKIKNVGIISVFSSIVIKGIRTLLFFFTNIKNKSNF